MNDGMYHNHVTSFGIKVTGVVGQKNWIAFKWTEDDGRWEAFISMICRFILPNHTQHSVVTHFRE